MRLLQGPRASAFEGLFRDRSLGEDGHLSDELSNAIAMLLVDATLDGDEVSLQSALRELQLAYRRLNRLHEEHALTPESRGRVIAFIDVAAWGLERGLSLTALAQLEQDSNGHAFLKLIVETPGQSNGELADGIGVSNAEVSRIGRRLADAGLAAKRRLGRFNHWEVTPKGLHTLELLESGGAARHHRPHFQIR
jgi:hypothetical protein